MSGDNQNLLCDRTESFHWACVLFMQIGVPHEEPDDLGYDKIYVQDHRMGSIVKFFLKYKHQKNIGREPKITVTEKSPFVNLL